MRVTLFGTCPLRMVIFPHPFTSLPISSIHTSNNCSRSPMGYPLKKTFGQFSYSLFLLTMKTLMTLSSQLPWVNQREKLNGSKNIRALTKMGRQLYYILLSSTSLDKILAMWWRNEKLLVVCTTLSTPPLYLSSPKQTATWIQLN